MDQFPHYKMCYEKTAPYKTTQHYQGHPHSWFHNYKNLCKLQFAQWESEENMLLVFETGSKSFTYT